jgi:PKHD-type hydroxylase
MKNYPTYAFFDSFIDESIVENIFKFVSQNVKLSPASVGNHEEVVNVNIRNCLSGTIPRQHWINGVLDYYVREVNDEVFNYDLTGWLDSLQFLFYEGKGTGYKWHSDIGTINDDEEEGTTDIRKLSLVLCLSRKEDYEGGELQLILDGRREMETLKLDMGDCVIFPSTTLHRVRPLKSGERTTIVGWYGGPDFR